MAAFWPVKQTLAVGELLNLNDVFPRFLLKHLVLVSNNCNFPLSNHPLLSREFKASAPGRFQARITFNGVLPLRTVLVDIQPVLKVYPGGQAVGVLLHSQGVIVVGYAEVVSESGSKICPAEQAGLIAGDVIIRIDGKPAANEQAVKEAIERSGTEGRRVSLEVKRSGKVLRFSVTPIFCTRSRTYRIGLLIKDSTAGVGTLTFYEPVTRVYGALGHMVTDVGKSKPLELADGRIIEAFIQGVRPGQRGRPGEKIGVFTPASSLSGTIQFNTQYGIFGRLERIPRHPFFPAPIPVAFAHQVYTGDAEMITVVDGNRVERFHIEIGRVNTINRTGKKDVIIRVTDPRLLKLSGGIIQGMSGSPIIQNGRLVGAVTHVFISNPEKGYGIFAERMVRECGLLPSKNSFKQSGLVEYLSSKVCCKI